MEVLTGKRDLARVKRDIEAAGYNGEKVVVLEPSDIPWSKAAAEITADWLHRVGVNVETPAMDWATLVQRRAKTEPVEQGGWSIFHTGWSGLDMVNPAGHVFLRGNGRAATVGWPDQSEDRGTARRLVQGARPRRAEGAGRASCNCRRSRTCPTSRSASTSSRPRIRRT